MKFGRRGLAVALLVTAVVVTGGLWIRPAPEQIQTLCNQAGSYAPLLFVAVGVSLIAAFVPKTAVSIAAGALFGTGFGAVLMLFVATLAAALSYALARCWMRERMTAWAAERPQWDAVRRIAGEGGFRLQLMLRLAPVPTMLISYACGAAGARLAPFLTAAAVAVLSQVPWIYSGSLAGSAVAAGMAGWISLAITVAAAVALAIYLKRFAQRELAAV